MTFSGMLRAAVVEGITRLAARPRSPSELHDAGSKIRAGEFLYGTPVFDNAEDRGKDWCRFCAAPRADDVSPACRDAGKPDFIREFGSSGRIRTYNPPVNSRMLYH